MVYAIPLLNSLCRYHWPGNIRELQHAVERAVILCRGPELDITDFHLVHEENHRGNASNGTSLNLIEMERDVICKAMNKHKNNLTKAAEELGIGRTTLYRKLGEYGIHSVEK
jgi:two-component system, NtrC family, response regulator HydG